MRPPPRARNGSVPGCLCDYAKGWAGSCCLLSLSGRSTHCYTARRLQDKLLAAPTDVCLTAALQRVITSRNLSLMLISHAVCSFVISPQYKQAVQLLVRQTNWGYRSAEISCLVANFCRSGDSVGMARKRNRLLVDVEAPSCTRPRHRYVFHYEQLAIPADRTCPVRSLFSLVLAPRL
jgi:hypothetical protein